LKTIERIGYGVYRVYWEGQHGIDPAGWCVANDMPCSKEPDPDHTEDMLPYQQVYLLTIDGTNDEIERFEAEFD